MESDETVIESEQWDTILSLLDENGEFTLDDLDIESQSERDYVLDVLDEIEMLGWVKQTGEETWEFGWKAEVFTEGGATDADSVQAESAEPY